ncbi:integrin alpha-8-like [Corticium candelabrum]|uniref:integrin alpha-8-like n=1 Tax=Corticium candelabrum TaxID=121492 RepID=UPI002E25BD00|nr:integrin alpha-8-like [Corticium candelabrum]
MVGAMFGYAIAAADLNWDGYSDLIVGAPFYGLFDSPNTGRIVAYLSDKESKFHDPVVVTGMVAGGMFGMAISSLGDIDLDGYEDVAVAAPFIGSLQSGEVYIYRGSEYGLRNIASQVIQQVMLKAFGYALANAIDIDGNHYPDLLVGAYQSQRVVLFRSRPVVVVTAKFTTYPTAVDIETSSCNYIQNYDTWSTFVRSGSSAKSL